MFGTTEDWTGRSHFEARTPGHIPTGMRSHALAGLERATALLGSAGSIAAKA